jgi:hypothetical protein
MAAAQLRISIKQSAGLGEVLAAIVQGEGENQVVDIGEVMPGMANSSADGNFVGGDISAIMQPIFNAPIAAQ